MYLVTEPGMTLVSPILQHHVVDKVQILLALALAILGLLLVAALVVSILAAIAQLLSYLLPPSIALPESVSTKKFYLLYNNHNFLVPAVDQNRNNYNNNNDTGENRSNRSLSLWLGRLQMGTREMPALEQLEPFINFANNSNDSPANTNSEATMRLCLIDLAQLSLDGYQHPTGHRVPRQIPEERGDSTYTIYYKYAIFINFSSTYTRTSCFWMG